MGFQGPPPYALGQEVGKLLCEALGLDPLGVRSIRLHNAIDDVAYVEVEKILTNDEGCAIKALMQRYDLLERGEATEVPLKFHTEPDGTLLADVTDMTMPVRKHAPLAPEVAPIYQDVTSHSASEPEYVVIMPTAGRGA